MGEVSAEIGRGGTGKLVTGMLRDGGRDGGGLWIRRGVKEGVSFSNLPCGVFLNTTQSLCVHPDINSESRNTFNARSHQRASSCIILGQRRSQPIPQDPMI